MKRARKKMSYDQDLSLFILVKRIMNDKELIELNKKHEDLVTRLRNVLLLGQLEFLKAGQILSEIKENETYKAEDSEVEWTWEQFIKRPDLPFPGRTPQSRRRVADALIRIYRIFCLKFDYEPEKLAPLGWTKLELIAPFGVRGDPKEVIDEWIERARLLSTSDLALAIRGQDKEIGDKLDCIHEDEYPKFYCPSCGASSKIPMNPKHKEIEDDSWIK